MRAVEPRHRPERPAGITAPPLAAIHRRLWTAAYAPICLAEGGKIAVMPNSAVAPIPPRFRAAIWAGAGVAGAMVAGTVLLWAHYGSAVFFEMIMAGLAACF